MSAARMFHKQLQSYYKKLESLGVPTFEQKGIVAGASWSYYFADAPDSEIQKGENSEPKPLRVAYGKLEYNELKHDMRKVMSLLAKKKVNSPFIQKIFY